MSDDNDGQFIPSYDTCDEVSEQCPISETIYAKRLSEPAAIAFAALFLIPFLVQCWYAIRGRTWSFSIWLGLGTALEVIGYAARIRLSEKPWSLNSFIVQYLCILLAPTLVAASISVTFKSLVLWYGKQWSLLRPRLYPWVFVGTDFLSIFIQIVGGGCIAIATSGTSNDENLAELGEGLVIGGVAFQVVNMTCCGGLMVAYMMRRNKAKRTGHFQGQVDKAGVIDLGKRGRKSLSRDAATEQEAKRVRFFIYGLIIAYVGIVFRCSYRIAENVGSIRADVLRNEPLFLALDGAMMLVAIITMTILHPYKFFPYLGISKKIRKAHAKGEHIPMGGGRVEQQRYNYSAPYQHNTPAYPDNNGRAPYGGAPYGAPPQPPRPQHGRHYR